jgi:3'-phosphoadenosine 5'-phosphosulfate sulfotransferase (PAPS reductase)/FAD synthetase
MRDDVSGLLSATLADITRRHQRPALMLSWGKDSLLLAHRLVNLGLAPQWTFLHCVDPLQPDKLQFVAEVMRRWHLVVYPLLPAARGIYEEGEHLNIVGRYSLGPETTFDLPKDVNDTAVGECGRYVCLRDQWISGQPQSAVVLWNDALIIGHKDSDVDPVLGAIPLNRDYLLTPDGITVYFPLRRWTDQDVWDFTRHWGVPVDEARYRDPKNQTHNPDWIHACGHCLRADAPDAVSCPRFGLVPRMPDEQVPRVMDLRRPYFDSTPDC